MLFKRSISLSLLFLRWSFTRPFQLFMIHWHASSFHVFVSFLLFVLPQIDYLRNYGYLPKTSRFGADILHEDTVKDALKALQVRLNCHVLKLMMGIQIFSLLQKLGNIEETGVLDDATKDLLRKPRCGNPDFEITQNPTRRHRQKRYALGPSKWEKRELTWK